MMIGADLQTHHLISGATYYTAHHNWEWVVSESLREGCHECPKSHGTSIQVHQCKRLKELPSEKVKLNQCRPIYALFRVETGQGKSVWATNQGFELLDAKDSLYRNLINTDASHVMPKTLLLDWNTVDETGIDLPTFPALLKAACGSGGFGLYFVHNPRDILSVIKNHAERAREENNFLEKLKVQYGQIPQWSLQSLVRSVRIFGNKRCQVRAYAVICDSKMFLYTSNEVRVPSWGDTDLDSALHSTEVSDEANIDLKPRACPFNPTSVSIPSPTVEEVETEICQGCRARPYNQGRVKAETNRLMLTEVPSIAHTAASITNCVAEALTALRPVIMAAVMKSSSKPMYSTSNPQTESESESHNLDTEEKSVCHGHSRAEVGIAGIDLMLSDEGPADLVDSECLVEDSSVEEITGDTSCRSQPQPHLQLLSATPGIDASGLERSRRSLVPKIVELNNNPAMPAPGKLMSAAYREHLVQLVGSIIRLGLSAGEEFDGFIRVW